MVFFVLLQRDMTIELYRHAANLSNNVFTSRRWKQHAHREKSDSLKWGAGPIDLRYIQISSFFLKYISCLKVFCLKSINSNVKWFSQSD